MRVVGIDPSLTSTGIAKVDVLPNGLVLPIWTGRIKSSGKRGDTLAQRMARLDSLVNGIGDAFAAPDLVVIEGPAYAKSNPGMHDRSGLWWLVVRYMFEAKLPVAEVPPTIRAKYATGRGNAGKDEVLSAVVRRYPDADITGNDEADALVLAAMGARYMGYPIEESLPAAQKLVVEKVAWPEW